MSDAFTLYPLFRIPLFGMTEGSSLHFSRPMVDEVGHRMAQSSHHLL